nr:MAG TPA: hypothetical protein [Caudoviricetes sp.]
MGGQDSPAALSRRICSRMARPIKALTDSPRWAAWALIASLLPAGSASDSRSRFAASHLALLRFFASLMGISRPLSTVSHYSMGAGTYQV